MNIFHTHKQVLQSPEPNPTAAGIIKSEWRNRTQLTPNFIVMKKETKFIRGLLPLLAIVALMLACATPSTIAQPVPGGTNNSAPIDAKTRAALLKRIRESKANAASTQPKWPEVTNTPITMPVPSAPSVPPSIQGDASAMSAVPTNKTLPPPITGPIAPNAPQPKKAGSTNSSINTNLPTAGLANSMNVEPASNTVPATVVPATTVRATVPQPAAVTAPATAGNMNFAPPAATPEAAAPQAQQEQILKAGEIDFPDVELDQLLEVYARLVDRTVLHAQLPQVKIKLRTQTDLTKTEAIQALDSILAMNGVTTINVGDKFVKAVPLNLAGAQAAPFRTNSDGTLPEADQYVVQIVTLKNAKPSELVQTLTPFGQIQGGLLPIDSSGVLVIRDYAGNVKRMLELIKQIDEVPTMDFDSEVIPIRYAKADEIASALSSIGAGGGSSIGQRSGGTTQGGGGLGGGSRLGGGAGGYGGAAGGGLNRGINGAAGGLGNGAQRTATFGDRLQSIVQRAASQGEFRLLGETKIIADNRTNSLLVFASKQDMAMIKKIIDKLDTVLPQVLIESIIMEVTLSNGRDIGVSLAQNSPSSPGNYFTGIGAVNNGTFLNQGSFAAAGTNLAGLPPAFSYWGTFGQDFQATLTATANDSRIHVLSRPTIQTSHGVTASIQVGQTVPEVSGTYFGGINGQASSQYQQQFVGIDLEVTPLINPDGLVVMEISQDVQQLGPNYKIDNNNVPSTTTRSAKSTVSVRDRDTIVLGGMISGDNKKSKSGVPFLQDIPGLGILFRSSSQSSERVELIVLIHPTVLKTPEAAAVQARYMKDHLPGIKAAEREDILEENRLQRKANSIVIPKREE